MMWSAPSFPKVVFRGTHVGIKMNDTFLKASDFDFLTEKTKPHFFKGLDHNILWFDFVMTS